MSIYTFLLDLNSINELKKYISGIISGLNSITYESRNVNLQFDSELSNEDKVILENAITNYTNPIDTSIHHITQAFILNRLCSTTSYSLISNYISNGIVKCVQVKCNINDINATYNLRIYDANNNIVLGELTNLNNTIEEIKNINIIVSINTILELHCYVSSNSVVCSIINVYNIY